MYIEIFPVHSIILIVGQKKFDKCSERNKRRKIEMLQVSKRTAELYYAESMNLHADVNEAAAKLIKEATNTNPIPRTKRILNKSTL